ncbi:MAG: cytochrome P450 [Gemmatimonadaceae bacterium]|jgi:cytochrome P450|nr:cytochrome P450 [Gemmatimonadota bacterium]
MPHDEMRLDIAARRLSLDPRSPAFYHDPSVAYARILAESPVVFWEELGVWCFFAHDDVHRLLRDRRFGREILHVATREQLGWPEPPVHTRDFDAIDAHSLLEREPPVHTRLRALINRAFVSRRVEALRPGIEALAHALVDAFPDEPFDVLAAYATPIPVRVIARLLGVPEAMAPALLDWSHRMVAMYGVRRTRAVEEDANAAAADFARFIRETVAARRRAPGDDLLSVLIAAEEQGDRLSEDELVSTAILLLNAGHEATVHALGNAVHALLTHGVDMVSVVDDDAAMTRVVEEVLRVAPPLHLFKRYTLQDTEERGILLRKGEQVALILGATGHDPHVNACPARFDITRVAPAHTSFGAGLHYCVGAPLARLELRVALQVLFRRCPKLVLAEAPAVKDSWHFHGRERLVVRTA